MTASLGRIMLFAKDREAMVAFYTEHFDYIARRLPEDDLIELEPEAGGLPLLLHRTSRAKTPGQGAVKLVFDVPDVAAFVADAAEAGLVFGKIFNGNGYVFANAKDPGGNAIQVSSRAFRASKGAAAAQAGPGV
ncbi:MAG: VOC family protein [Pseudomonadota bacterium]